jgi:hypothetical protein
MKLLRLRRGGYFIGGRIDTGWYETSPARPGAKEGEKMIRIIRTGKQVWKVAALLTVMVAWSVGTGFAGEALKVLPINPVPDFRAGESTVPKHKKVKVSFDGGGRIDRVGKDETGDLMVINDRLRYLSPSVTYHSGEGGFASPSQFRAGKRVGYLLNKKREITDLYFLGN